jgi:hypothetical protein
MEKINGEARRTGLLRATLVAGGLGMAAILTACGASDPEPVQTVSTEPRLEAEYYQNGNRMLRYQDDGGEFADVFQTCDGADLLEQTEFSYAGIGNSGVAAGNSVERTAGYAACADGRLTESDFQVAR